MQFVPYRAQIPKKSMSEIRRVSTIYIAVALQCACMFAFVNIDGGMVNKSRKSRSLYLYKLLIILLC